MIKYKDNSREGFTMKRLVAVLSGLLVLPAFAEVAPFVYDDAVKYSDIEYADDGMLVDDYEVVAEEAVQKPAVVAKPKSVATSSRNGSRVGTTNTASKRGTSGSSRVVSARTTTSSRASSGTSRTVASRGTVSRAATRSNTSDGVSTRRATTSLGTNTARVASIGNVDTTNDPLYTGRVSIRSSGTAQRVPTIRVASATVTANTSSSAASAATSMDELTELTDYCKAQYTACMDNFCNVLDDNQGRCSCSKNLKNYEKTENALKAATEELQDVAQKIQYIGLTGDEITTLFSETEAEEAMRSTSDSSQMKTNLDKIKNMIIDVKTGTSSGTSDSALSFDLSNLLDFSISSTGFDLSSLFGTTSNTSSISNQRGETLYKTASARCKANVINACVAQGVDASVITNSYDLEIDKQCIAYERSLSDSNDQMTATVRNAKTVLQKARLMVAQQKNQYDLRECISALDSCMQDDYVCGADYENCLDPSGKYIVNGQIVAGSMPGKSLVGAKSDPGIFKNGLYNTWCTDSGCTDYAWDYDGKDKGDLAKYIKNTLGAQTETNTNMSKFLQYKIGYHNDSDGKNYGMCMSVLNKCQDYTYDKNGKYKADNNVVSEYLYRTMTQIRAAQDTLLANYAENCVSDVLSCLSSNNYDENRKNIAVNACKSIITTCMSVNGNTARTPKPVEMVQWASNVYNGTDDVNSNSTNQEEYDENEEPGIEEPGIEEPIADDNIEVGQD